MYVSAAFDHLYPENGGFPEPDELASSGWIDRNAAGAGITFVAELFPRVPYGTSFDPAIFTPGTDWTRTMWPLYATLAEKTANASVLVAIDDAITFGPVIYAGVGHDRKLVYETYRPNDRIVAKLPTAEVIAEDRPFDFPDDADYVFLASVGSFNYGHFLVDDLPRSKAVGSLRARPGHRRIVIVMISHGAAMDNVREIAIRQMSGMRIDVQFLPISKAFRFERLYYPTPVSSHPIEKNPLALDYVSQTLGVMPNPVSKLMILRKTTSIRGLLNQTQLVARLKPLGFSTLYAEDLSFDEQIDRFAGAAVIVGEMGASMTNTMFASPMTKLVYLAPTGWIEPFYWDLALTRRQSYRAVYGTVMTPARPIEEADFVVPPDFLLTALS